MQAIVSSSEYRRVQIFVNRRKAETHTERSKQTSGEYRNKAAIPGVIKQYYLILPYNYLVQLTAAAGQGKQLRKTLMNDCNNFMNEDKRIYIPKESGKKKPNPQHKTLKAQQLQVANNTPHQANKYYTASKTLTFSLASSGVYSNTHSQILDLGIKKALACSHVRTRQNCKVELFQQQREMQA